MAPQHRRAGAWLRVLARTLVVLGCAGLPLGAKDKEKVVPKNLEELQAEIRKVLADTKTPGIGIALVSKDATLWAGGLGKADVASGREATADTLFRIGSISKGFVSLSVLKLQEEGRLGLEDRVSERVPEVWFENPWEATDPVRIVHLLEHTTGFDDIALREYALEDPSISLADALAYHPASRVSRWRPGTRFRYCNSGPAIAARIVENLTGQRFEDYVAEHFFRPLKMETAGYFLTEDARPKLATLYHTDGVTPQYYWHIGMRASGSVNASAAEMANYVRFYLNRGSFEGRTLVASSSIERMERPATTWAARAGVTHGYGLGNYTKSHAGFVFHGHNGGVNGGLSSLGYLPEHGVGYVFMINSGSGEAYEDIETLAANYLTKDLPKPAPPATVAAPEETAFSGYYRPDTPRPEMARFLARLQGVVHVSATAGRLTAKPLIGKTTEFVACGPRLFRETTKDSPIPTLALVDDPTEGRFLQSGFATWRPASAVGVWLERVVAAASLLLMATSLPFALIWIPRKLFRRMKGVRHLSVRALPLLATLCLVAFVAIFTVSAEDLLRRFGSVTPWSLGLFASSLGFALFSVWGLLAGLRAPREEMNRWARLHSIAVSAACVVVAAYFAYWGIIGLRTWA